MKWSDFFELLYIFAIPVVGLGPAIRWFSSDEGRKSDVGLKNAGGVLVWTLIVASVALYASFSRGEKLRHACRSFQDQIGASKPSDEQFDALSDADWWEICHPSDFKSEE